MPRCTRWSASPRKCELIGNMGLHARRATLARLNSVSGQVSIIEHFGGRAGLIASGLAVATGAPAFADSDTSGYVRGPGSRPG